jgi:hypothetical protein
MKGDAEKACRPAAEYFGLPVKVVTETLAALRARVARADTARATAEPRPTWQDHKGKMALPDFVTWAYAAERAAGNLTKATLRADKKLYTDYFNWRRKRDLPPELYWLRDLPTKREMNDQLYAESGINPTEVRIEDFSEAEREVIRRYETAKRRGSRARGPPPTSSTN